jgi:hypothetical protein
VKTGFFYLDFLALKKVNGFSFQFGARQGAKPQTVLQARQGIATPYRAEMGTESGGG